MIQKFISLRLMAMVTLFCGTLFLSNCSNKPTDEEMRQLVTLRAEVASLQLEIEAKQKDKEDLENQVNEKKAKLQSILDEQKSAQSK